MPSPRRRSCACSSRSATETSPSSFRGGLVPEILTRGQGDTVPRHLGTADVDIHVSFGIDPAHDLRALERALESIDAEPDSKIDGWRWQIPVGGFGVKIEFLCDREDVPADQAVALPGCHVLTAANLRGTGFVARDWVEEELTGKIDGDPVSAIARYAGLEGYLMAKACAARDRGLGRDYYDLVFVLIYSRAGGPAQAAELLCRGPFAADVVRARAMWREIEARFAVASAFGPESYAAQALLVEPQANVTELRQDAVGAVAEFIAVLQLE